MLAMKKATIDTIVVMPEAAAYLSKSSLLRTNPEMRNPVDMATRHELSKKCNAPKWSDLTVRFECCRCI